MGLGQQQQIDDMWILAHKYLLDMNVGDYYMTSTTDKVECTTRKKSKIKLSNGLQVTVKKSGDMVYLTSGSFRCKNRSYNRIDGILRDVEGYLIWKKLTNDCV